MNNSNNCIYGQMTGNCFSNRAKELIRQCDLIHKKGIERIGSALENYGYENDKYKLKVITEALKSGIKLTSLP
jgi:hypothetical protein